MKRLEGKIALVTGASRGIGRAVALAFANEGAHLILVARTRPDLEKLDDEITALGGSATLVQLDVTDGPKIDELGLEIFKRFGKLDILVGNAGVLGSLGPMHHLTPKIWQQVLDVNLTANFRLIRSFDALLRASANPRAIFVTSEITKYVAPYWGAYAVSKAALEEMVKIYAAENATTNIRVNLVDPGSVDTKMHAAAMPGIDPDSLPKPQEITEIFVKLAMDEMQETGQIFDKFGVKS